VVLLHALLMLVAEAWREWWWLRSCKVWVVRCGHVMRVVVQVVQVVRVHLMLSG
jgi:hypothetical protein